ncbi:MAG: tetratricopeptide repeat protein [Candidatus Electryonea clarkiae]|nr:tetratricopeptide repeat protein [Candidatus Electryonea clarkiae]MDP8288355.1 tetratricopeptide repeat protein [Candidatus Electryonea clarkiae]
MSIKMPSQEEYQSAQLPLEYKAQVDRYEQMIQSGDASSTLWYNLGVAHLGLQEWDKAGSSFMSAIELEPEMVQAHVNLGAAYYQLEDFEKAAESLKNALKIKDDFLPAMANLGVSLMRLSKHQESIDIMEKVIKLEPKHPVALGALTLCYKALGDEEKARKLEQAAIDSGVSFKSPDSK